jgi:hypothetical protein
MLREAPPVYCIHHDGTEDATCAESRMNFRLVADEQQYAGYPLFRFPRLPKHLRRDVANLSERKTARRLHGPD